MTTPKRRWFRFSLRSLFVLLTLVGLWLGWDVPIIRQRQALLRHVAVYQYESPRMGEFAAVPWHRRVLGDEAVGVIYVNRPAGREYIQRAKQLFPEAHVFRSKLTWHNKLLPP